MILHWYELTCFKIQEKIGSEMVTIVTDPFDKNCGLKVPRLEADILTVSLDRPFHGNAEAVKGSPYLIKTAGEYDIKGISIDGVDSYFEAKDGKSVSKNIIYRFELDSISLVHLGVLGQELDDKQLEKIASPDILLVPVGNGIAIGAKRAVEIIARIEPRIVVPMYYKLPGLKENLEAVERFVKELGIKPRQEEKLKVNKKDLPQGETELVILQI